MEISYSQYGEHFHHHSLEEELVSQQNNAKEELQDEFIALQRK